MPETISKNKFVSITYTITDEHGSMLESNDVPTRYIHGVDNQVIEKIEAALEGKQQGETIQVSLSPEEGFGSYLDELVYVDDLQNVPEEFRKIGAEVEFKNDQGESRLFRVTSIDDDKLTVDGNHPFAGMTVIYNITINEVRDPTTEESNDSAGMKSALH